MLRFSILADDDGSSNFLQQFAAMCGISDAAASLQAIVRQQLSQATEELVWEALRSCLE